MNPLSSDFRGAVRNAICNLDEANRSVDTGTVRAWLEKFFPHWKFSPHRLAIAVKTEAERLGLVRQQVSAQFIRWNRPW